MARQSPEGSEPALSGKGAIAYRLIKANSTAPPTIVEYVNKANELSKKMYGAEPEKLSSEQRDLLRELAITHFLSAGSEREKVLEEFSKNKSPCWYEDIVNEQAKGAIEQYRQKAGIPLFSDYYKKNFNNYLLERKIEEAATLFEKAIHLNHYVFFEDEKKKWKGFIRELFTNLHAALPYKVMAQDPLLLHINHELGPLFKGYDEKTNLMRMRTLEKIERPLPSLTPEKLTPRTISASEFEKIEPKQLIGASTFLAIGADAYGNADSITLLAYDKKSNMLNVIALYRGLEVVPNGGLVNWLLPKKGPEKMVAELERFFGVKIDGWAVTDMEKFKKILESIKTFEDKRTMLLDWVPKTVKTTSVKTPQSDKLLEGLRDRGMVGWGFERAKNSARFIARTIENIFKYSQEYPKRTAFVLEVAKPLLEMVMGNTQSNIPSKNLLELIKASVENPKELTIRLFEVPHFEQKQFTKGGAEYYLPAEVGGETYYDGLIKTGPFEAYPKEFRRQRGNSQLCDFFPQRQDKAQKMGKNQLQSPYNTNKAVQEPPL